VNPSCARLVSEVKAGRPGITELIHSCLLSDLLAAVEGTTVAPNLDAFTVASGRSGKFKCAADDPLCDVEASLSWEGSCVGHLPETVANDGAFPPESCLVNTVVRETEHRPTSADLADEKLMPLSLNPELERTFWTCTKKKSGHACFTEILGPPSQVNEPTPTICEMHCLPKLADAQTLVFACSGSLARRMCDSYGGLLHTFLVAT